LPPLPIPTLKEIEQDFAVLDDWEDRYRYIIELGRELPPFEEAFRTPANKVQGCASQVWLKAFVSGGDRGGEPRLSFTGDSDALIVRGLIAIAFALFSGQTAATIARTDAEKELEKLELADHLTPQRSNGFRSLIARIKEDARLALSSEPLRQAGV
jgi:cysteine desulfuration protein SufE